MRPLSIKRTDFDGLCPPSVAAHAKQDWEYVLSTFAPGDAQFPSRDGTWVVMFARMSSGAARFFVVGDDRTGGTKVRTRL